MSARKAMLLGATLLALPAFGVTVLSEDFSTFRADTSSTTAVWNVARREIHVPFAIDLIEDDGIFTEAQLINIGSGVDGPFDATTLSRFDVNQGSIPNEVLLRGGFNYEFSTFELPYGYTLKCTGTSALILRVQGDLDIQGTINVNGTSGSGASAGVGVCGGGNGGNGGAANTNGGSGSSPVSGGAGGGGGQPGGSGGGAGHDGGGATGAAGGGSAGSGGISYDDGLISGLYGGAGGGGGAGAPGAAGGGGGAGGGVVFISAGGDIRVGSPGAILAKGGDGVNVTSAGDGAPGSGGAIVLFAGGRFTTDGNILAGEGSVSGGSGGTAATGRVRYVGRNPFDLPGGTMSPTPNLTKFGISGYSIANSYRVESLPYDLNFTYPMLSDFLVQKFEEMGTLELQIAGSRDNFVDDVGDFLNSRLELSRLEGKRYFKFGATLKSYTPDDSPRIRSLTLNGNEGFQSLFYFRSAACAAVHRPSDEPSSPWGALLLLAYLVVLPFIYPSHRKRTQSAN